MFKKLEDRVRTIPLKERIEQALFRLNAQKAKLEHTSLRLQQRDKEMFQRCVGAELSKDPAHAKLYANECAEIRKMAQIVLSSELALERVILRMQTIEEFGDIMAQIAPVIGVVRETRGRIAGVIPEVANELGEVNNMLSDMSLETGDVGGDQASYEVQASSGEAQKVLEESSLIAEQQMKERFPQLPVQPAASHEEVRQPQTRSPIQQLAQPQARSEPVQIPVPATADDEEDDIAEETVADNRPVRVAEPVTIVPSFEERLLDYIKLHNGEISISTCASELSVDGTLVKQGLEKLRNDGKIVVE